MFKVKVLIFHQHIQVTTVDFNQ